MDQSAMRWGANWPWGWTPGPKWRRIVSSWRLHAVLRWRLEDRQGHRAWHGRGVVVRELGTCIMGIVDTGART